MEDEQIIPLIRSFDSEGEALIGVKGGEVGEGKDQNKNQTTSANQPED